MPANRKIQRALFSVTDKTGLVDFARALSALGIELISTGGRPSCCEIPASRSKMSPN